MESYNPICKTCARFRRCCPGTVSQVWTGCIWKIKIAKEDVKMYLVTFENGEENYHGPFERIVMDSVGDSGISFLCHDNMSVTRISVPGIFDIVKENYLEV